MLGEDIPELWVQSVHGRNLSEYILGCCPGVCRAVLCTIVCPLHTRVAYIICTILSCLGWGGGGADNSSAAKRRGDKLSNTNIIGAVAYVFVVKALCSLHTKPCRRL